MAGQDQTKREVLEFVEILRDSDRSHKVGAAVPLDVPVTMSQGVGKTSHPRALAGEAGVPFCFASGSEFVEAFVGAGRVHQVFEGPRKLASAQIFMDDLDSIGLGRGTGQGGGHDDSQQKPNQTLAKTDGGSDVEAVVVFEVTSWPDVLDPALLRSGRFDSHVPRPFQDKAARCAIFDLLARTLSLCAQVDLDQAAVGKFGSAGADFKNLLKDAASNTAQCSASRIVLSDLDEARDTVALGEVRVLAKWHAENHRLAAYEPGHTAVAFCTHNAASPYLLAIIPHGHRSQSTQILPTYERRGFPEAYFYGSLSIPLAGRAAEIPLLGSVISDADDHIRCATDLARSLISPSIMDLELSLLDLRQNEEPPCLGQQMAQPQIFSDAMATRVNTADMDLFQAGLKEAPDLTEIHCDADERFVARLEEEELLDMDAIKRCLGPETTITPFYKYSQKDMDMAMPESSI